MYAASAECAGVVERWNAAASVKVMQAMAARGASRQLSGYVQIDGAYLSGERNGSNPGRGSENKQAFLIAAQTDAALEHPTYTVIEPVRSFDPNLAQEHHALQAQCAQALQAGQSKAAEGMLTPNFEVRTAANPGKPIPRAQWIQWMLHNRPMGTRIDGMAVHDYGTVAVVSFHQHDVLGAAHVANDRFVVDVWVKQATNWLLSVRYSSAGAPSHRLQGAERKG